jgi:hypothetical protein
VSEPIAPERTPRRRGTETEAGKTAIQVIERMVGLLDALAAQPDAVSLKELSLRTGLHPSTAHRILNDLVTARFVDRAEPGAYQLGMRLLELGNLVKARLNVRDAALGDGPAPAGMLCSAWVGPWALRRWTRSSTAKS